MRSSALELYDHGLSVIPVQDKKPTIKWEPYQKSRASRAQVETWFANGNQNIGIVTGSVSGVVVLDVDNPEALTQEIPRTPTVKTGRGVHYYFKHPGFEVRNFELPCGDFRGDGGQVVAPPSGHRNGGKYEWLVTFDDAPLADMPAWLLALAKARRGTPETNGGSDTTPYGKPWFDDCEALAQKQEPGRNNLLNEVACKAGSLVAAGQLDRHEAESAMLKACGRNGLVRDDGWQQVRATLRSGIEAGLANPRYPADNDNEPPLTKGKLSYLKASDIRSEKVPWLWEGVLIKGAITFLAGDGGLGKSTIALDIASRISNGSTWPVSDERIEQGNVVYLTNEDDPRYTIRPRLEACGANLDRVFIPEGIVDDNGKRLFDLKADIGALEEMIREVGDVSLIIIDPFNAYLGKSEINNMGEMRGILNPFSALAQKHRACVMFIHHFNKNAGSKASSRMAGSIAMRNAARTVWLVDRDPENADRRIMVSDKSNLGNDRMAYACTIKAKQLSEDISATYLEWDNKVHDKTSDQVLMESQDGPAMREAKEQILSALQHAGMMEPKDLIEELEERGIKRRTIYLAKDSLDLIVTRHESDKRRVYWSLPN